jgi:hypothetical protein
MKKNFTFFISVFFCISITTELFAQTKVQDSLALVDLYNNTNAPHWNNHNNWLTGPVPTWFGITVIATRVTQISLAENKLKGNIPVAIGNLLSSLPYF